MTLSVVHIYVFSSCLVTSRLVSVPMALFCSYARQKKLENVNERVLRLDLSDDVMAKSTTIHNHSTRLLALEVYKA